MNSLDSVVELVRAMLPARFPSADWAALVIHQVGRPDTSIVISPATLPLPSAAAPTSLPQAS